MLYSTGLRILLVDNSSHLLEFYKSGLEAAPHAHVVEIASDAYEAIKYLENQKFDVAIVDFHLIKEDDPADWSGYHLAIKIVDSYHLPTILMSGGQDIGVRLKLARQMADHFPGGPPVAINIWAKEELSDDSDFPKLVELIEETLLGRNIFIVHGHDRLALCQVENVVFRMGLRPVTLAYQPGEGKTIIEKLLQWSNVGFIIIIMTGDDIGAKKTDDPHFLDRARQNVILELGLFIGKYKRDRIALLLENGVELPSDIQGVEWILYDPQDSSNPWKYKLYHEMRRIWPELRVPN